MRSPFLLFAAAALCAAAPTTYVVSARGGTHASLQAAIDACPAAGCRIELPDSLYEFSEPVSIRGKSNLSIAGTRGDGTRPVLTLAASARELAPIPDVGSYSPSRTYPIVRSKASHPDTIRDPDGTMDIIAHAAELGAVGKAAKFTLHPGRAADGSIDPTRPAGWLLTPFNKVQAQDTSDAIIEAVPILFSGLLAIDSSRHVRVAGLEFDGGTPISFETQALWDDKYDQIGGLAAITMTRSFQGEIVDCEFHDWFVAVRSVDANQGGLASDLMAVDRSANASYWGIRPLADPGTMGGHRIEDNLAHHNDLFVSLEQSWDLSSSVRFNRAWENGKTRTLTRASDSALRSKSGQWETERGGFLVLKDVVYPSTIVQGNTLVRNTLDLGHVGWRASTSQLFFDNVSMRRDGQRSWNELTNYLGANARNNWIAATKMASLTWPPIDSVIPFCSSSRCEPLTPAWGSAAVDEHLVAKGLFGNDLGARWQVPRVGESIRVQDQTLGYVERVESGWSVTLPIPVQAATSIGDLRIALAQAQKVAVFGEFAVTNKNIPTPLPALLDAPLSVGVNMVSFRIPASAKDSIWLVELAVSGTDGNTGSSMHSNLGTWLVRPLGKQLQIVRNDTGSVEPGQSVTFSVYVRDSTGRPSTLSRAPAVNAPDWSIVPDAAKPAIAARASDAAGRFEITAKAPSVPGISRLVFVGEEEGRLSAIPGAVYVAVGGPITSTSPRAARSAPRVSRIRRDGAGWNLEFSGLDAADLAEAMVVDASGRRWKATSSGDGRNPSLRLPRDLSGTCFLRSGGTTVPLVLVP